MGKRKFTPAERWEIYYTHGHKCYLCTKPINLCDMQVDHILPEFLLDRLEELENARTAFNLSAGFDINSAENWLPSCAQCNNTKRGTVFEAVPIIEIQLRRAKSKAALVNACAASIVTDQKMAEVVNTLERAAQERNVDAEKLRQLIDHLVRMFGMTPLRNFSDPDQNVLMKFNYPSQYPGQRNIRVPLKFILPLAESYEFSFHYHS